MKWRPGVTSILCMWSTLATTAVAWAQNEAQAPARVSVSSNLGPALLSTLLFALIGIVLAIVGFKLFDAATPFSLEREICEKQNLAAGILGGAIVIGICLIIAATVLS